MMKTLLSILLIFSFNSLANDHEAPAAKAGEHGEAKEVAKELPEWVQIEAQLSSLEAKIRGKESNIAKLISEKEKLTAEDPQSKKIVNEMISEHKDLQNLSAEYDKQRALLKYRYPEKGAAKREKYKKIDVKSLDKMEEIMTVDGRLSRNIEKMRAQYGDQDKFVKPKKQAKGKAPATPKSNELSIEEANSIVIGK